MPSFKVIMSCSPWIRTNSKKFQDQVVLFSAELIILLSRRHKFDYHEVIDELSTEEYFIKDIETLNTNLDGNTIKTFKDLMNRHELLAAANEFEEDNVLGHGHSIVWHCATKYQFPGKLYEDETFTRTDPVNGRLQQLTKKLEEKERELTQLQEQLATIKENYKIDEQRLKEIREIDEWKQRIIEGTDVIYE